MEFKIPKKTQLLIDAWRVAADILDMVDMDDHEERHGGDDELIGAIYEVGERMREIGKEIQEDQEANLRTMERFYNKHRVEIDAANAFLGISCDPDDESHLIDEGAIEDEIEAMERNAMEKDEVVREIDDMEGEEDVVD